MRYIFLMICFCCFLSCNRSGSGSRRDTTERRQRAQINIVSPQNNERQPLGAIITLSARTREGAGSIDSLRWFVNGIWLETTKGEDITWNTAGHTTGTHRIEVAAHYSSGQREFRSANVLLLAPQAPREYTYRVLRVFPHDPRAFTQGLLFHDGYLYESTGLLGESTLRKVDLETGIPIMKVDLPPEMFGEGLALVGDRLIQLTWQNQVAFIYQKSDFTLLQRINYNIREGWGLTFDGTYLLKTDGSANLYFLDKDFLTEVRRIEVCDHNGPVHLLNELEYINGELWANVWQTDDILRIDPKTGVVLGRINMTGLLPERYRTQNTDVLNGIAYDEETGRIFVTGKNWSRLFEIQVIER